MLALAPRWNRLASSASCFGSSACLQSSSSVLCKTAYGLSDVRWSISTALMSDSDVIASLDIDAISAVDSESVSSDDLVSVASYTDNDSHVSDLQDEVDDLETVPTYAVAHASNREHRKWDKKYSCYFCKAMVSRLRRHLYSMHSSESEVAAIMALGNSDKVKKQMLLTKLRNIGSYVHNNEVLKTGAGELSLALGPQVEPASFISKLFPVAPSTDN